MPMSPEVAKLISDFDVNLTLGMKWFEESDPASQMYTVLTMCHLGTSPDPVLKSIANLALIGYSHVIISSEEKKKEES